jgi:Stress responsive A/B Barrel Domain
MNITKIIGYGKPVFAMCAFMLIIYGAYTPSQKAEYQLVISFKFKNNVSTTEIEKHLAEFKLLRKDIAEIVDISAGKTVNNSDYDVMHYVTFRNKDGVDAYEMSQARKAFFVENQSKWDKSFTVMSKIEK